MGYLTQYNLSFEPMFAKPNAYSTEEIREELEKMNAFEYVYVSDNYTGDAYVMDKWYDFEDDMCLLSKKFPHILFQLHGQGDDAEDMWNAYFFDGKEQFCRAEVTYPDMDVAKMKPPEFPADKYSHQVDE